MRARNAVLGLIAMSVTLLTGCGASDSTKIEVRVVMNGCLNTSCVNLPLPAATVRLVYANGVTQVRETDRSGVVVFDAVDHGNVSVEVRSSLLSRPITTEAAVTDEPGGRDIIDMAALDAVHLTWTR